MTPADTPTPDVLADDGIDDGTEDEVRDTDDGDRLTDLAGSWDRRVRTARWGARSARG